MSRGRRTVRTWLGAWLLAVVVGSGVACRRGATPPGPPRFRPEEINGERVLAEVENFLQFKPRTAGSGGAARAAEYLEMRLRALDIETVFVDEFTDATPLGPRTFRNVVGTLPGRADQTIVLVSHYDTKAGVSDTFEGANDGGSSVALLLELGRVLRLQARPGAEIVLAFLDGEECAREYGPQDGLHGSRRLAQTLVRNRRADKVKAVIVLDMIGDRNLNVTVPRNGDAALTRLLLEAAAEEGARKHFGLTRDGGIVTDDHVPFLLAGMPAIDVIDFEYGSAPGQNDYWHTPADTLDKLSAESLQIVGRVVVRLLNKLP